MKSVILIVNHIYKYHVAEDTLREFEKAILHDNQVEKAHVYGRLVSRIPYLVWRAIGNLSNYSCLNSSKSAEKQTIEAKHWFIVLMGSSIEKSLPYFLWAKTKSVYMFDAWPKKHANIIRFANFFRIKHLFLSSRYAAEQIGQGVGRGTRCHWIPEAIESQQYHFDDFTKKNIDVLALGRRFDKYHSHIAPVLEKHGKTYFFEKKKGEIIFSTRQSFTDGLARSKVSICFPASLTHPEMAEGQETMTMRFLQSMASKCLIVGHAPAEMVSLFGYNPVVEVDWTKPAEQLIEILENYESFFSLIERNFNEVISNHTWHHRWLKIQSILDTSH